jgi:hypothetical protein
MCFDKLMKQLAIRLGRQQTASKSLVISTNGGCLIRQTLRRGLDYFLQLDLVAEVLLKQRLQIITSWRMVLAAAAGDLERAKQ